MQFVFFLVFFFVGKEERESGVRIRESCRSVGSF